MIYFIASWMNLIEGYIEAWAPELSEQIKRVRFKELSEIEDCPPGVYIFSDLERAKPEEMRRLTELAGRVSQAADTRILNDPRHYLARFDFLRRLHAEGINDYRVHRPMGSLLHARFPVFVRSLSDHAGPIGELLQNRLQLAGVLLKGRGRLTRRHRNTAVVEYCDCSDDQGVFRKYSVFKMGDLLMARHLLFSRNWAVKIEDLHEDAMLEEESQFIEDCQHLEQIAEVFRLGGIDYGRIDYGIKDGRIQVWEINTNPVIISRPEKLALKRRPTQARLAERIRDELKSLAE